MLSVKLGGTDETGDGDGQEDEEEYDDEEDEEEKIIIFDNGSGFIKAGFSSKIYLVLSRHFFTCYFYNSIVNCLYILIP